MPKLLRRSLTYANVTSTLALVLAMAGGALAANHYLITSSKQINPRVLRSLKGAKGKTGASGPQGLQGPAGAAGGAGAKGLKGIEGLTGAPGEPGEKGAQGNAGGPAAHWRTTIAKAGESKATAATVTLETVAPFTISGECWEENGETVAGTFLTSSEAGAFAAETEEGEEVELKKGVPVLLSPELAEGETKEREAKFKGPYGGLFSAESKGGTAALDGAANEGVFLGGGVEPACYFSGFVVSE